MSDDPVVAAFLSPTAPARWDLPTWESGLHMARRADLVARIAHGLQSHGMLDEVPEAPRAHLQAALLLAQAQRTEVIREIAHIRRALAPLGIEPVLLKGAAYVAADLPAAAGRMFADVDILVPKTAIGAVEAALMTHGWATTHHTPYDQRYYRQWMHEIPPLVHIHRHTVLDVHHAILPETARVRPDAGTLWSSATPTQGPCPGARVLAPCDMVLHSMTHLFFNEEHSHALRDISDLDLLLRHFQAHDPGFGQALLARATSLGLQRVLYHGLRQANRVLHTPVPDDVMQQVQAAAPRWPVRPLMDALWRRAIRTPPRDDAGFAAHWPLTLLYVRGHALRMPAPLLVRHLATKAWMRLTGATDAQAG